MYFYARLEGKQNLEWVLDKKDTMKTPLDAALFELARVKKNWENIACHSISIQE